MPESTSPRSAAFAFVIAAYIVAGAVAWFVTRLMRGSPIWAIVAVADVAATLVVFAFSKIYDNSSIYDPYWSVAPIGIAAALALDAAAPGVPAVRRCLVVGLVFIWGTRLTLNWARGWRGRGHEDWRYVDLRRKTGKAYWPVSLFGLHLMPTFSVYLGCLAFYPALCTGTRPLGVLDFVAALVTAGAITLETAADEQLRAFRRRSDQAERIMDSGLWRRSRHPNYLGEITFWWGIFLFGLAGDSSAFWAVIGPLWITALFAFISVPMMDRRHLARRPGYAELMGRVPALLPTLFRQGS
jgi:steroid 5-alpha reductase family enzyme